MRTPVRHFNPQNGSVTSMNRRHFLALAGASTFTGFAKTSRTIEGVFPIVHTPFTTSNEIDMETLAAEVRFFDKCGVQGIVWPQLASEYFTLGDEERLAGVETILQANKGLKPAVVVGVQSQNIETAKRFAIHAEKNGADAIIAIPPKNASIEKFVDYYRQIGRACSLPLVVQAIGEVSVDDIIGMAKQVPTLAYVKDEAGFTPHRITEFAKRAPQIKIFTGNHGQMFPDELYRGAVGTMPAGGFADLYVNVWELWRAGNRAQAMDEFARANLFISEVKEYGVDSVKYILELRGVFKNHLMRQRPAGGGEGKGTLDPVTKLDEPAKQYLAEVFRHITPYLRTGKS